MINIKIQKKDLWLLSAIMVFLVGVAYVIAYGSGQPTVHGHDVGEIEGAIRLERGTLGTTGPGNYTVSFSSPFLGIPLIKIYAHITWAGLSDFETTSENVGGNYYGMYIYNVSNVGFTIRQNPQWTIGYPVSWVAIGN